MRTEVARRLESCWTAKTVLSMTSDAFNSRPAVSRRTQEEARVAEDARAGDLDVGREAQGEVDEALKDVELDAGERVELGVDEDGSGAERGVAASASVGRR